MIERIEPMERIYHINGLDCANCAAKLERHLKEIAYFDNVIIDFMAQKVIVTAEDETHLQKGLLEAEKVINRVEPGVTITEKAKKQKNRTIPHAHHHGEQCSCGHEHHHEHETHAHAPHEHHHGDERGRRAGRPAPDQLADEQGIRSAERHWLPRNP